MRVFLFIYSMIKLINLLNEVLQEKTPEANARRNEKRQEANALRYSKLIKDWIKTPVGDSVEAGISSLEALDRLKGKQVYSMLKKYDKRFPEENLETQFLAKLKEVLKSLTSRETFKKTLKENLPTVFNKLLVHDREYPKDPWWKELTAHMIPLGNAYKRMVYVFEFPDNSAYIGLTYDEGQRKGAHLGSEKSPVFRHIQETGQYPEFYRLTKNDKGEIVKTEDLSYIEAVDAQKLEHDALKMYKEDGWKVHNVAPAGSLGGGVGAREKSINSFNEFLKDKSNSIESFKLIPKIDNIDNLVKDLSKEEQDRLYNKVKTIIEKEKIKTNDELKNVYRGAHNLIEKMGWTDSLFGTGKNAHGAQKKGVEGFIADPNNLDKDQLRFLTKRAGVDIAPEQEKILLGKLKKIIDKYGVKSSGELNKLDPTRTNAFDGMFHQQGIDAQARGREDWRDVLWPTGYPGRGVNAKKRDSTTNESIDNREIIKQIVKSCCSR